MKTKISKFVMFTLMLLSVRMVCNSQTQSMLLPVPGATTATGPCSVINFSSNYNPVITSLPAHPFLYANNPGNPHVENQLELTLSYQNGIYRIDEVYLGQHPMYAQNIVHDADGNLLFFIVDNNIYNRYGEAMIDDNNTLNQTPAFLHNGNSIGSNLFSAWI